MNLPDEQELTGGGGIGHYKNVLCIFGVEKWKSSRMQGRCLKGSEGLDSWEETTPVGKVGAEVPPSLISQSLASALTPRGPGQCQRERALWKAVDEAGWKTEK